MEAITYHTFARRQMEIGLNSTMKLLRNVLNLMPLMQILEISVGIRLPSCLYKASNMPEILLDIQESEIINKELLDAQLRKEIEMKTKLDRSCKIICFSSDSLSINEQKQHCVFNFEMGLSFDVDKEKRFCNYYDLLMNELCVAQGNSLKFWLLDAEKESFSFFDEQSKMNTPLNELCTEGHLHFYVEILSSQQLSMDHFQKDKHAFIFIKEYDSMSKRLIFHMHRYFMLDDTVADLQAFIKKDGDTEDILIVVERGSHNYTSRQWEGKHAISKITTNFSDTHSAMVVFEIINGDPKRRTKYIRFASSRQRVPSIKNIQVTENRMDSISTESSYKNALFIAALEVISHDIFVVVKNDTDDVCLWKEYNRSEPLSSVVHEICDIQVGFDTLKSTIYLECKLMSN